jgi:hypothetical protein
MPKRRLILGILALGILAALIVILTLPREPSYQGRSLSDWFEVYAKAGFEAHLDPHHPYNREAVAQVEHAFEMMGTNATPLLVEWIRQEPRPFRTKAENLLNKVGINWHPSQNEERRANRADWAICWIVHTHDLHPSAILNQFPTNPPPGPATQSRINLLRYRLESNYQFRHPPQSPTNLANSATNALGEMVPAVLTNPPPN